MTEIEKLRTLLAEAQYWLCLLGMPTLTEKGEDRLNDFRDRIDAALAEPVGECAECAMWKDYAENIGLDAVRAASETYKVVVGERDLVEIALAKAERERDEARAENTKLRSILAKSNLPCVYCGLAKERLNECKSGFPSCGRLDDLVGEDAP